MTDDALSVLRRLFAFNWDVRAALVHAIGRARWEDVTRVTPAEPRSVVDATLDLLETEAYWAHFVLDEAGDSTKAWQAYDRSNVTSAERLAMHAAGVERATATRLARLTPRDLVAPRTAPGGAGWTAGEVLLRAAAGTLLEAGVIAGRLAAIGVKPALPGWSPSLGASGFPRQLP